MRKTICALGAMLLATTAAAADDSSAALGAGGIVFTKGTPVRMKAEDLYVSPKSVRIRFEFSNDSDKDVDTLVAFPLPDVDNNEFTESPMGTITDDPVNFIGFKAVVDGKPVTFRVEVRAFYKGKDVTDLLKSVGAPLNVVAHGNYQNLDAIKGAKLQTLIKADLVDVQGENDLHPHWLTRTNFYWTQRFPAHKTVVVEHSYQPVTGQSFAVTSEFDGSMVNPFIKDFCMDPGTLARVKAKMAAKKDTSDPNNPGPGLLNLYETDYILKTANNWNGPIGHFHLTLDKLKVDNALSLCWGPDLKKTGPTTFESTLTNFAPSRDIKMAIFE
jgi:hypothetical protein